MGRDVACPIAAAANTAKTANQLKVQVLFWKASTRGQWWILRAWLRSVRADGRPCQVGRSGLWKIRVCCCLLLLLPVHLNALVNVTVRARVQLIPSKVRSSTAVSHLGFCCWHKSRVCEPKKKRNDFSLGAWKRWDFFQLRESRQRERERGARRGTCLLCAWWDPRAALPEQPDRLPLNGHFSFTWGYYRS